MKFLPFLVLFSALISSQVRAEDAALDDLLREFDQNPKKFMDSIPQKARKNGVSLFSLPEIRDQEYIDAKNTLRPNGGRAGIEWNDEAEGLVDNGHDLVSSLSAMEEMGLRSVELPTLPWSDSYWPLVNGELAHRYGDPRFPWSKSWRVNADYVLNSRSQLTDVNQLSPAEKYDLLVGDGQQSLTMASLAEGEKFYAVNGRVESWMGICHGWAPASYSFDRPARSVRALAADGVTLITFYPSDIKALASLLWAKAPGEIRMVGGRCNVKNPQKNEAGRVIDQNCFDTNPGTWHLAVVNQIGVSQRSLIMDAIRDYEVWNHPIYAYEYKYFNPQTRRSAKSLADATVSMNAFTKDKFREFRSPGAVAVVGVQMTVDYRFENDPSNRAADSEEFDEYNSVNYQYDLELDGDGRIIGGEWYRNTHPDFLWTPVPHARALTAGDYALSQFGPPARWNGQAPVPAEWSQAAFRNNGLPLATIVESLMELAK